MLPDSTRFVGISYPPQRLTSRCLNPRKPTKLWSRYSTRFFRFWGKLPVPRVASRGAAPSLRRPTDEGPWASQKKFTRRRGRNNLQPKLSNSCDTAKSKSRPAATEAAKNARFLSGRRLSVALTASKSLAPSGRCWSQYHFLSHYSRCFQNPGFRLVWVTATI